MKRETNKAASRCTLGACRTDEGVAFRVWAPDAKLVEVAMPCSQHHSLQRDTNDYFVATVPDMQAGDRYKFRIDGKGPFPDPVSRFQPEGPHGWSEVVDERTFAWSESETSNRGQLLAGQILYELHIGTFTPEGAYAAAEGELERLHDLGITMIELMPLAEFPGRFGWGYDGVQPFAPFHEYGTPDQLRHLIDTAHQVGLGVILDVVYNHFGPDGNYLSKYSPYYFSQRTTEWGDALNFDGQNSGPVREFFCENTAYWIRDFHFDGLRLDATQSISDACCNGSHILAEIANSARKAAGDRNIILVSECERQERCQLDPPEKNGFGLDAMWNDDLHHSAIVRLTGMREAYYSDHLGRPQEFLSATKYGFLFQGQFYGWQQAARGTSALDIAPKHLITFLENHDQVANSVFGARPITHSSPDLYRAMCAYSLLTPGTPMFFMGQEYGSHKPFHYFADHNDDLQSKVAEGRKDFLSQFHSLSDPEVQKRMQDPGDPYTFEQCKLDSAERETEHSKHLQLLFHDLLTLRREDPAIRRQTRDLDGSVLTEDCFVLRYFFNEDGRNRDRLLVINFGRSLDLKHLPEPLLAPPTYQHWTCGWSSEDPRYGGGGSVFPDYGYEWLIGAESAMLLVPSDGPPPARKPRTGARKATENA